MIIHNKIIENKPSLILDIDETLIKSNVYNLDYIEYIKSLNSTDKEIILNKFPQLKNIIEINNNIVEDDLYLISYTINNSVYIVMARPYLKEFIINMNHYFNIHIYSLGMNEYINKIIEGITNLVGFDPFCHIIANVDINNRYRDKKLYKLSIGLSNVLIIDDRKDVWKFDRHNLYQILPYKSAYGFYYNISEEKMYYKSSIDDELLKLNKIIDLYYNKFNDKTTFNIYQFNKILFEQNY